MKITELIKPTQVLQELRAPSKRRVLEALAHHAAQALKLDAKPIVSALVAREELGSTGMGEGAAIPHARLAEIGKPYGVFARLKTAVEFEAIDGRPVDLVCLLLLPTAPQGEQLNALACVARRFRDRELLARLRAAPDAEALYRSLEPVGTGG